MICFLRRVDVPTAHGEDYGKNKGIADQLWGCGQTAFPALAVSIDLAAFESDPLAAGDNKK